MTPEELILEQRRRFEAGEFKRQILGRKPRDFHTDVLILDCGHQKIVTEGLRLSPSLETEVNCWRCAEVWKP